MKGVIFFVFLCFLLLRGYNYMYTGIPGLLCRSPLESVEKQLFQVKQVNKSHKYALFTNNSLSDNDGFGGDAEDDDHNTNAGYLFTRKFKPLTTFYLTFTNTFITGNCRRHIIDDSPFSGHFSCKYITQRALRI